MLSPQEFCNCLTEVGIRNAIGVPDSLMKGCAIISSIRIVRCNIRITANEGGLLHQPLANILPRVSRL